MTYFVFSWIFREAGFKGFIGSTTEVKFKFERHYLNLKRPNLCVAIQKAVMIVTSID